jgi:soluble lytic murein transglycosylase-like protein
MKKFLMTSLAAVALVGSLAACSPKDRVHAAIDTHFGDAEQQAIAIARCESSLNPKAVSPGGGNHGLFQINTVHRGLVNSMGYSWSQLMDPFVNADVARVIYDQAGGWGPWSCKRVL